MKHLIILLIAWSFVFIGQKTFAQVGLPTPSPAHHTVVYKKAITENGDTVNIIDSALQTKGEFIDKQKNNKFFLVIFFIISMVFVVIFAFCLEEMV